MSHNVPVRVPDMHAFDTIIDARSPAEFAQDHIPGAINCPVLDDEERHVVGTIYVQTGAFEARRVGAAMVAQNIARHLRERFPEQPANWRPLVYCWRGGMRSGSMVTVMRLVGWDAQQLAGGYKAFRRHVVEQLDTICPGLDLRVICGATGSAKTRVLQALSRQGAQVVDLEELASHKGSLLGGMPGQPQPTQKHFETLLHGALAGIDLARPLYVEAESARIGRLSLPLPLVARMRAAPRLIELKAGLPARLAYLLRDYVYLTQDRERLAGQLAPLKDLQGKENVQRWQQWARDGEFEPLLAELMTEHYDPLYERSQARHFSAWSDRQTVPADVLDEVGIETLARQVLALG
ncbi:tRNA 2-selenouridine(34) synthase MnmH [Variovorax dokdonensis]|uniref:tRNA 2-selenouridine(34) synthase MnmH n=1 Tax=Variovorax dokdonensis TaxID=344883 RepID=A0ABT7NDQ7_9BURK|nr:tRNA 2-selenouridine(34) synthase MnmH [Variovorax dokdonensis]